jgi:hypothetical protein
LSRAAAVHPSPDAVRRNPVDANSAADHTACTPEPSFGYRIDKERHLNTALRLTALTIATALVASLALATDDTAAPAVQLEPVHIVAARTPVALLPPVNVTARRAAVLDVVRLPRVEIVAERAGGHAKLLAAKAPRRHPAAQRPA